MRSIGMDVHRSFAQVAIWDDGDITDTFRIDMEHDAVATFGRSLRPEDEVILEATGTPRRLSGCWHLSSIGW